MPKVWINEPEYRRVLEILNDYWITEPDEYAVIIDMQFRHRNGEYQHKRITWKNSDMPMDRPPELEMFTALELMAMSKKELMAREEANDYEFLALPEERRQKDGQNPD